MSVSNLIRTVIVGVLMLCIQASGMAEVKRMSLISALRKRLVAVKPLSCGGYTGNGLQLGLINVSCHPLQVDVEPGLIFTPSDPQYQNLVVAGNVTVTLPVDTMTLVPMQTYCGKSYAHSPRPDITYKFWKQGEPGLVKVMEFVNDHHLFADCMAQSAVWAFTNDHDIAGIYDSRRSDLSKELVALVAKYKHQPVPQYHVQYEIVNVPGRPSFTGRRLKIFVELEWGKNSYRNMVVQMYRADGSLYKEVTDTEMISDKGHKILVTLDPEKTPKGKYFVRLRDDDNYVWTEKTVEI